VTHLMCYYLNVWLLNLVSLMTLKHPALGLILVAKGQRCRLHGSMVSQLSVPIASLHYRHSLDGTTCCWLCTLILVRHWRCLINLLPKHCYRWASTWRSLTSCLVSVIYHIVIYFSPELCLLRRIWRSNELLW